MLLLPLPPAAVAVAGEVAAAVDVVTNVSLFSLSESSLGVAAVVVVDETAVDCRPSTVVAAASIVTVAVVVVTAAAV